MNPYQHTIKNSLTCHGIGLHTGRPVSMTIKPAQDDTGICFERTDVKENSTIPAFMDRVVDTRMATTLAESGVAVSTTEHLLAALRGMDIDNALIELDTAEVPIMDGSAGPFVELLRKCGRRQQSSLRRMIRITDEITFRSGDCTIQILPYNGFKVTAVIDFAHALIKKQAYSIELSPEIFTNEIADARTFGFMKDVEMLHKNGLALGGSLDNAVVIDDNCVLNEGGLRYNDEFVRHKILDIIGDVTLLGAPLLGHIIAHKSGHGQHLEFMHEIAARTDAWEYVTLKKNGKSSVDNRGMLPAKKNKGKGFLADLLSHPAVADSSCAA